MSNLCKSFLRAAKLVVLTAAAGGAILLMACEPAVPKPQADTPTTPTTIPDHGLGLERMDVRAYQSTHILRADPVSLPSSVDISVDLPPPGDQKQQPSCVGWAVAYALKSFQERTERGWPLTNNRHIMSPAYVYNQVKLPGGGAFFVDAFSLVLNEGVSSWATMPYNPRDDRTQPSAAARSEAANYKIADWGSVLRTTHAQFVREVKRHLVAQQPVVIGIPVKPDFYSLGENGNDIYDDTSGQTFGGHAIVIVGYDDARSAFKIINSWGTGWGFGGYGWIDYDASDELIWEAYVTKDVRADVTPATPVAASNPNPDNAATAVETDTQLSWTKNDRTTSFDVYIGTERNLSAADFQGSVAVPSFSTPLAPGATYYWRVDARGPGGLTNGRVWSFTTAGGDVDTDTTPSVAVINPDVNRILKAGVLTDRGVYHSIAVGELAQLRTGPGRDQLSGCIEEREHENIYEISPGCYRGVGRQRDFIGQLLDTNGYDVSYFEAGAMPAIDADDYDVVVVQDPLKTNGRAFTKASMEGSVPDLLEHVTSSRFRSRVAAYHQSGGTLVLVGDAVRLLESGTSRLGANKTIRQVSVDNTVSESNSLLATQWLFVRGNPFCGVDRSGSAEYTASSTTLLDSTGATLGRLRLFNGNDIPVQNLWSDTIYAPTDGTSLLDVRVAGTGNYVLRGNVCSPPVHTVTVDETVTSFMGYTLWNNRKVFYIGSDSFFDYRFRNHEGAWHAGQYIEINFRVTEDGRRAVLELVKKAAAESGNDL